MGEARGRWRLALGAAVFALAAPPSLGLPLAALLAVSRPVGTLARALAAGAGSLSAVLLVAAAQRPLGAAYAAWTVLATAAFVAGALAAPAPFWRQATRATACAAIGLVALTIAVWGGDGLDALRWEATREALAALRAPAWTLPDARPLLDRAAAFAGATVPATLALQTMAGLGLAWQLHVRIAERPLGGPLRPFREFRLGDAWVWGVVLAVAVWLLGHDVLAQNLAVLLGTLYLLQGAAITVAFGAALGISTGALVAGLTVAAVLFVPLLFIVPGLWTLGVTDTWVEYRRRLATRSGSTGA